MKYSLNLDRFLVWWAVGTPKRIVTVLHRIFVLTNNEVGFTLNLGMLFVPIFGDYTIVGRIMGVIYRLGRVVIGTGVLLVVALLLIIIPFVWYAVPFYLLYETGFLAILYFIFLLLGYEFLTLNRPHKKVSQVHDDLEIGDSISLAGNALKECQTSKKKLLEEIAESGHILELLKSLEINPSELLGKMSEALDLSTDTCAQLQKWSLEFARENNSRFIEVEHIFLALIKSVPKSDAFLARLKLSFDSVKECAFWLVDDREALAKVFFWQEDYTPPPMGGVNRGWTGRITPLLNQVSDDYTKMAGKGYFDVVVGKDKAISEVIEALSKGTSNNVLVVGEPGSGKTTMVKGLAQEIVFGTQSEALKFKRLVALNPGSLIAGCKTPGEVSEKIENIVKEVRDAGNIIIFVDEVHNLVASGGGDNAQLSTVFSTLEPYLSSGVFQFIGATSGPEYRKYIEPNGAFTRLFQVVTLEEASPEDTLKILKVLVKKYRKLYRVSISFLALKKIIELSKRLIHDRVLPDKAVAILERACVHVARTTGYVTSGVVGEVISGMTKVPVSEVSGDESAKLLSLESELKIRVIGQDDALYQVSDSLRRARAGVRDEKRPIASFLFVGSTGVGKTETAKAIAESYFGDEKVMIRLDMSEYQKDDAIDKLIGTSDGKTVGFLTNKVRSSPFSLILLDEIEKASPKVLLAFLQVLDDGRLTDSSGRVIDFTNSIIIATSNVGTAQIQRVVNSEGSYEDMKKAAMQEVTNRFAPEFLNRFSGIVTFKPLYPVEIKKIAELLLQKVVKTMNSKNVSVSFTGELIDKLATEGFDPQWGARPLRRLIENTVESYLARKLLGSEISPGDEITIGTEVFDSLTKQ